MVKIIYRDLEKAATQVRCQGVAFTHGEAVEVKDEALVAMARANPFFEVEQGDALDDAPPARLTPRERGTLAARAGKRRAVPPSYPGREEWLAGYDAVAGEA